MEPAYTNLNMVEEEKHDDSTETDEATDEQPDEESNNNKEEDEDMDDDYKALLSCRMTLCAIYKTSQAYQAGTYWIANLPIEVFSNKKLLTNIRDVKQTLTLYCNA